MGEVTSTGNSGSTNTQDPYNNTSSTNSSYSTDYWSEDSYYSDSYDASDPYATEPDGWGTTPAGADPWASNPDGIEDALAAQEPVVEENKVQVIDNALDPQVTQVAEPDAGKPQLTKVYLPLGYTEAHGATFTIPLSASITAEPGTEENSVIFKVYNADGTLIGEHTVYVDPAQSWIRVVGGRSINTEALAGTPYAEMIYFNKLVPVEHAAESVLGATTKALASEELGNGDSYHFYTAGNDVVYALTAKENSTYTASYVKNANGKYSVTLTFYSDGELSSTVTIDEVQADTAITVSAATLTGTIDDQTMKEVLGLVARPIEGDTNGDGVADETDDANGDGMVDEGDDVNGDGTVDGADIEAAAAADVASAEVQALAAAVGKGPQALLEVYQYTFPNDRDGDGEIKMADLNAFLASLTEPTGQLLEFLAQVDPVLGDLYAELEAHGDERQIDTLNAGKNKKTGDREGGKEKIKVIRASDELQKQQGLYRNRLVELLRPIFPEATIAARDEVNITITEDDGRYGDDVFKQGEDFYVGAAADDIVFNGVNLDLFDFEQGMINIQTAYKDIDFDLELKDKAELEDPDSYRNGDNGGAL